MDKYSIEDITYNNELQIVESLYAFHPQYFSMLEPGERDAMSRYYLFDQQCPEDIFAYRHHLVIQNLFIEQLAKRALSKLMYISGMN